MLSAVRESGGTGVAVSDAAAVEASLRLARGDGPEASVTAAVALAGAVELADRGVFGPDDDVVVINTGAGCKTHAALGEAAEAGGAGFDA
jgi:threonine synthase